MLHKISSMDSVNELDRNVIKRSKASSNQSSLWFIHQCTPDVGLYNVDYSWKIPPELDLAVLQDAINYLTDRHEMLRSIFVLEDGELQRHVLKSWRYVIEKQVVGDITDEEIERRYIAEIKRQPFDLAKEPAKKYILFQRDSLPSVLMLAVHHILFDLMSMVMFLNELNLVYGNLKNNEPPQLPILETSFDDYLAEQASYLASDLGKRSKEFWQKNITRYTAQLNIPRVLEADETNHYFRGNITGPVGGTIQHAIKDLSQNLKLSEYELYFAVYILLLHKFSGQKSLTVGAPTSGRSSEHAKVLGYFVNPVLVNSVINVDGSVRDCLLELGREIKAALKHRQYPLPLLSEEISTEQGTGGGSLFKAAFTWQSVNSFFNRAEPIHDWDDQGRRLWHFPDMGTWECFANEFQLDEIDISIGIHKLPSGYHWHFEYNQQTIGDSLAKELAKGYLRLATTIATSLDKKVSQLSVLDEESAAHLIQLGQGAHEAYDSEKTFVDYFESLARDNPSYPAVTFNKYCESYAGLNQRANKVAYWLSQQGVKPGSIVAVSLKRSIDLIACILGVMKTGGAYLPLDSEYPRDRIQFMISDANVAGVICDNDEIYQQFTASGGFRVFFKDYQQFSQSEIENPVVPKTPDDLVYVIYTSGSTGRPKGVELTQRCLSAFIHTVHHAFGVGPGNQVLQFASINFDVSLFEFVASLTTGSTLHMASKESLLGDELLRFMRDKKISVAHLTPAILASTPPTEPLPDLKILNSGGERCTREIVANWSEGRRLINAYGPTEATVYATIKDLHIGDPITIGRPLPNSQAYVLDSNLQPVPQGVVGELYLGGDNVARGYLNRPDLNAERFLDDPFRSTPHAKLYKTGDLARFLDDGNLEFLGRTDHQVKIRGYRIELDEISEVLIEHPAVHDALVMARGDIPGATPEAPLLAAYVVKNASEALNNQDLSEHLKARLPEFMLPSAYCILDAFPLTPSDKVDRKALPLPDVGLSNRKAVLKAPRNEIERIIAGVWQQVLGIEEVCISENFFDIGGHSILLAKVYSKLPEHLSRKLRLVDLFQFPTIQTLAHFLEDDVEEDDFYLEIDDHAERLRLRRRFMESFSGSKIAIVGMSGRFPGATSVERFWQNICDGEESITFFTDDELRESGVPEELIRNPDYVPAKGKLKNIDQFDANFFNFTAREAQITDPQQRIFLECAWEALEDACCVPEKFDGSIGVFAGTGINQYLTTHLSTHPELLATVGDYSVMIGNDKDFLASRVAYKLNLNGPAMVLQTACSTSLVAVHTACQSLLNEECDAALAGGVSLGPLGKAGYLYQEGMILSPDGHCRAFSADAKGTVQGQGCGVVVLKRLDDALKSHDNIYAVIVGSATNNDGSNKTGYTAPSVEGQAKVINMALATANLNPAKVGYIETHGTGTPLGDPIEIEGLRQAFKVDSGNTDKCAIGSVKTNIGHLDAASGVTGLIKAAKAINQCELPPSLHFSEPNPQIDFSKTHFYVNTALKRWEGEKMTRFAGVSSFGIGGTNAHVILAEPPNQTLSEMSRPWRVVTLSARTATALDAATKRFVAYLQTNQTLADPNNFSNICYSLHVGRRLFPHRRYLVCRNADEAIAELTELDPQHVITSQHTDRPQKLVFMFSGQGSQYINMGSHLYRTELTFRKTINQCRKMLSEKFVHLYEEFTEEDHAGLTDKIHQTQIAQPGLFIFEYALAQTFISWNIKPDCLIGHSIGEFVAACLSGVFTLDQALELVTIRGNLMQGLEGGDMLSVNLPEEEALALTNHDVSLAAVNGPSRCVLSGTEQAINYLHQQLDIKGVENRILHTSHAFHSHMMEPILERFKAYVERRKPQPPKIPFVSSLTGEWITDEQATSAQYWADHLRYAVQFNKGLHTVFERTENNDQPALTTRYICLEMGPGKVLSTLARQHPAKQKQDVILASTRHAYEEVSDVYFLLKVIAKLWELGVPIDWEAYHSARQRYRVPLPTYPFERQSYWVKPRLFSSAEVGQKALSALEAENELGECAASHDARDVIGDVIGDGICDASHVAPRDDIERKVYSSWRLSLGINDFDIHDNFFDLGGDSLVAVNLIAKIKTEFKIPIATPVLMQRQTVAELAEYIRHHRALAYDDSSADREASPLVLIQKGSGEKIPIIMVHPIGGEVFFYRDLAHHLGVDQTLYAFQAISLAGTSEPINSVSALADFYIQALKRRGLEPPYILGGSSFGGLVAYEMAQQLNEVHNKVSLVIMIDTPAPTEMPENLTSSAAILDYLLSDKLTLDNSKLATLDESAQIDYVLEAARGQGKGDVLPPHLGVPLFKTWFAHQEATRNYQPKDYRGDVIYFRHTEPQAHFPALPHRPWQAWVSGQFMIHQVPGSHVTMNFPPHVQVLASHLKPVIKEAQG